MKGLQGGTGMKHSRTVYWTGFTLIVIAGCAAALTRAVPTQNTVTFLFALTSLWEGCLTLLGRNPVFRTDLSGRYRIIYGWSVIVLGLMWLPVSVHPRANEGWLQAATGIPVLAVITLAWYHYKKKKGNS